MVKGMKLLSIAIVLSWVPYLSQAATVTVTNNLPFAISLATYRETQDNTWSACGSPHPIIGSLDKNKSITFQQPTDCVLEPTTLKTYTLSMMGNGSIFTPDPSIPSVHSGKHTLQFPGDPSAVGNSTHGWISIRPDSDITCTASVVDASQHQYKLSCQ
jgi:hypothetical protein